uniref:Peptidase A1 domain-containing protein n=1 Tax=Aegilops tauschii subsp. strangulata TaxID=200361 RepID=A0A453QGU3_AEGTS
MALLVPLLVLLLFSSSCGTSSSLDISHGATAASVGEELNYYVVVETTSLEPSPVCQGHRVSPSASGSGNLTGGAWVPLSHPNGPCSEAGNSGAPWSSAAETLQWDQHRAGYIQRKLSGDEPAGDDDEPPLQQPQASGVTSEPGKSEVTPTATVGGGSLPGVTQHMVIDTASDVPWVQCAPCPKPQCHPQTDATYDPSKSTTYAPFPCSSPVCRQLGPYANGCTGAGNTGQCQYRVQYPDGSSTSGTYISDVLTISPPPPPAWSAASASGAATPCSDPTFSATPPPGSCRSAGARSRSRRRPRVPTATSSPTASRRRRATPASSSSASRGSPPPSTCSRPCSRARWSRPCTSCASAAST